MDMFNRNVVHHESPQVIADQLANELEQMASRLRTAPSPQTIDRENIRLGEVVVPWLDRWDDPSVG